LPISDTKISIPVLTMKESFLSAMCVKAFMTVVND
jgi:hypothetical protein